MKKVLFILILLIIIPLFAQEEVNYYIVNYPEEIKTIEYENVKVQLFFVTGNLLDLDTLPISGANIVLNNGFDVEVNSITNENGEVNFFERTYYTGNINLTVDYGDFHYEGVISPYMWSMSEEATGPSTGKHIIRDAETGYLYMVYYQYNPHPDPFVPTRIHRVILAESYDEGDTWYLTDFAEGKHPTIDIMGDGTIGIHYDIGIAYMYENVEIPNPSTITNGSIFVEPGSMWSNLYTDELNTIGIKYLGAENAPYLVFANFTNETADNAEVNVLIGPEGKSDLNKPDYLIVPSKTPTICMKYDYLNDIYYPEIAFVDTNWEIIKYSYDSKYNEWNDLTNVSQTSSRSMYPYIDAYGSNVTLVWQEEVAQNDFRIYTETGRFKYDTTETSKKYPKIKNGSYLDYVENETSLKLLYFTDQLEKTLEIYNEEDSVYFPDITIWRSRKYKIGNTIFSAFGVKTGEIYKIKTSKDEFTISTIQPLYIAQMSDTEIVTESALYNYINGNRPIERLTDEIKGLNPNKYYEVELIADIRGNNPVLLTIDSEEMGILERGSKGIKVIISQELYQDRDIIIEVDRVKGNPNREVLVNVYEYEEIGEGVGNAINKRIKMNNTQETFTQSIKINTMFADGAVNFEISNNNKGFVKLIVYDIIGREVRQLYAGEMNMGLNNINWDMTDNNGNRINKGVYIYKMETEGEVYQGKIIKLK